MPIQYTKLTSSLIQDLESLIGQGCVLTDRDILEDYSSDETFLAAPSLPLVVVKPTDASTISKLLKFASLKRIPVTTVGGKTGLSGGSIPILGGIVLSMEAMNHVLEIDKDNFAAVVEPGVTLTDLYNQVEQEGLYYPIHPGETTATIGGTVATNAGGLNAVKYGVTRHNILGLQAVLANGEIIRTGGKFVKCSSGYDLTQLIIGSEGTLAVITEITLKLTLKPVRKEVLFVPFSDIQDAIDTVPDILRLPLTPTGIEFMERSILEIVEKYLGREIPYHDHAAYLMIIMEGESENDIYDYFARVEEICLRHGALEAKVPGSERAKRQLIEAREKFFHAIKKYAPMELIDIVVPRSKIAEFIKRVKEISVECQVPVIVYGHAGDGNVHLHPICLDMTEELWRSRLPSLMREIYTAGSAFGGAVSGEHGIGLAKKDYFKKEADPALLEIMKEIKIAFDPRNILNPGKIFDPD
jgi:glycolate oxidase